MPVDSYVFLLVILTGFVAVWSFRTVVGRTDKLGEFEYLGLSAFWGLAVLMVWILVQPDKEALTDLDKTLKNPYASGFLFSILGGVAAGIAGWAVRSVHKARHTRVGTWLVKVRDRLFK